MSLPVKLVGKVMREKAEVILVFRVGKRYYPNTPENAELFESYLHTGDEFYLSGLTDEMEVRDD